MKTDELLTRNLPYKETDQYVDALVERTTRDAIAHNAGLHGMAWTITKVAAAVAVAVTVAWSAFTFVPTGDTPSTDDSYAYLTDDISTPTTDRFLNELSDDEATLLASYELSDFDELYY